MKLVQREVVSVTTVSIPIPIVIGFDLVTT